jgi:hypothetical protein
VEASCDATRTRGGNGDGETLSPPSCLENSGDADRQTAAISGTVLPLRSLLTHVGGPQIHSLHYAASSASAGLRTVVDMRSTVLVPSHLASLHISSRHTSLDTREWTAATCGMSRVESGPKPSYARFNRLPPWMQLSPVTGLIVVDVVSTAPHIYSRTVHLVSRPILRMLAVSPSYGEYNSPSSGVYRSLARELVRTAGGLCAGEITSRTTLAIPWHRRRGSLGNCFRRLVLAPRSPRRSLDCVVPARAFSSPVISSASARRGRNSLA